MTNVVQLDPSFYIASGAERHVYLHPSDDRKLLKVMRPQEDQGRRFTFRDITTNWLPSVRLRLIRKEYDEYLRVQLNHSASDLRLPITHMYGLEQTNLGLACVAERVAGTNNPVGETLRDKIRNKTFTEKHLNALNDLVTRFYRFGIRAGDIKPHNLVFGHRDAGYECVLVDGFGDIHAVPVRSLGRWANALGLNDSFKQVALRTGLIWDKGQRQFSFPSAPAVAAEVSTSA